MNRTKIDAKNRTGALTGLVKPGECYLISQVSPGKLVFTRVGEQEEQPVKARLIKVNGRLLLTNGRKITNEDVQRAKEGFP